MPIKLERPKKTRIPGIRQDGPSRFLVRADWTDDRTGQRKKREAVVGSFAEAVALREQLRSRVVETKRSRVRFSDFAERWIGERAERLAPSTRERYALSLAHLCAAFGNFYVDGIRPGDIRRWRDRAAAQSASPTVNGHLRVLRQALEDSVLDGSSASNPARAVKALPEKRTAGKRGRALSIEEFRRFLESVDELTRRGAVSGDVARLMLTLAWTGCRRGEVIALRWDDYADGELRVERSVWGRMEKATKTDDPRRVAVVAPLAVVLEEQRRWLFEEQHPGLCSGLVFPARPGNARASATRRGVDEVVWYRCGTVLNVPLAKVVEAAKIPPVSPHSFRRTYENALRRAGVDQLVRRSLAGWRTEEAQEIYANVDAGERKAAGQAVVALVLGGKG